MATRTARATYDDGSTHISLGSGLAEFDVSFPRRKSDESEGATSPEELIAAAHSSCYNMHLASLIRGGGGAVRSLSTDAQVRFGVDPNGGFRITGILLTVRGEVDGLDPDQFREAADVARTSCPVSKALTGTDIALDAALK